MPRETAIESNVRALDTATKIPLASTTVSALWLLKSFLDFSSCLYVPRYFQGEYSTEIDAKKVRSPHECERSTLSHVDLIAHRRALKTLICFQ